MNWHISRRLGTGCYGAVYRGELKDGSEVAIKLIDLGAVMGKGESPEDAGFDEEVQMLSKFRHPNLVTLLGWGQQGLCRHLVYEFLQGGDVFQRLHRSRHYGGEKTFHWYERLSTCQDASTGLSHMHNSTPKAFHRDIKSANILLDRHGTAKMADFGLSCTSGQSGALHVSVKTISGTPGYKCPIYERSGRFTEGSEVYSFGMVMLEVLTGLDPSASDPTVPGGISYPVAEIITPTSAGAYERCMAHLDQSASWPQALASEWAHLALRTVSAWDERTRPHFVEIVRSLRSMGERFPRETARAASPHTPVTPKAASSAKTAGTPGAAVGSPELQKAHAAGYPSAAAAAAAAAAAVQQVPPPQRPQNLGARAVVLPAGALGKGSALQASSRCEAKEACSEEASGCFPVGGYVLELLEAAGREAEALAADLRGIPLVPGPSVTEANAGALTLAVGRHQQTQLFEAWLPDLGQRSCISRKSLELTWMPGMEGVRLLVCGTNPLYVDNMVAPKGSTSVLKLGSEVAFTYEQEVLLRFRLAAAATTDAASTRTASSGGSAAQANSAALPTAGSPQLAWSMDRAIPLPAPESPELSAAVSAARLHECSSVAEAVEALNSRRLASPKSGFCVVLSNAAQEAVTAASAYFLLFQPGMEDTALLQLGFESLSGRSPTHARSPSKLSSPAKARFNLHTVDSGSPSKAGRTGATPVRSPQKGRVRIQEASGGPMIASPRPSQLQTDRSGTASWKLRVIHAEGMSAEQLAAFPPEQRDIEVRSGITPVGRHHQGELFEQWLPDDSVRNCISRLHMEVNWSGSELAVTNMSTNWLCVEREPVPRHRSRPLEHGHVLSFAREEQNLLGESSLCHFLMLQVMMAVEGRTAVTSRSAEVSGLQPSSPAKPQRIAATLAKSPCRRRATVPMPGHADVEETRTASKSSAERLLSFQMGGESPSKAVSTKIPESPRRMERYCITASATGSPKFQLSPKSDVSGKIRSATAKAASETTMTQSPAGSVEVDTPSRAESATDAPPILLELHGSGVHNVPVQQRSIGPVQMGRRSLLVGRGRQPELHSKAVCEEVHQHLNRDDFCICYEASDFWLLVMCDTPLWHESSARGVVRLNHNELVKLEHGDRILLGYSAQGDASSPSDAVLSWRFNHADPQLEAHPPCWYQGSSHAATNLLVTA